MKPMLTLLDPLALLDEGSETETNAPPAFIIPLRGDEQLGLAVESVNDAIEIYLDQIVLPDQSSDLSAIRGVVHHEHGPIVVLETTELFDIAMHGAERRRRRT